MRDFFIGEKLLQKPALLFDNASSYPNETTLKKIDVLMVAKLLPATRYFFNSTHGLRS